MCVLFVLFGSITCCLCPFCIVWVCYMLCVSFLCCLGLLPVDCDLFVLFGSITCCLCPFCVVWVCYLLSLSFLCCLGLLMLCVSFLCCMGPLPVDCLCPFCVIWVCYLFLFGVMLASFQTLQPFNKLQPEKYVFFYLLFCGFGANICT